MSWIQVHKACGTPVYPLNNYRHYCPGCLFHVGVAETTYLEGKP